MFTLFFVSVGEWSLSYVYFLNVDIMTKEVPQSGNTVVAFRAKSLERGRGKGSIETVAVNNPSSFGVGPSTAADRVEKERGRKAPTVLPRGVRLLAFPFAWGPLHQSVFSVMLLSSLLPPKLPWPPWLFLGAISNSQGVSRSVCLRLLKTF